MIINNHLGYLCKKKKRTIYLLCRTKWVGVGTWHFRYANEDI